MILQKMTNKFLLKSFSLLVFVLFLISSCGDNYVPKPHGYLRTTFPHRAYQVFDSVGFPYKFVYPKYSKIQKDTSRIAQPFWIDVNFQRFNAKLHISYHHVNKNMYEILEDVRNLAYKHTVKADAIKEIRYENPSRNVYGIIYDIRGNAASSLQFFLTDSTQHFLRGAFYFNARPNIDSLQTSIDFFRTDIDSLIKSVQWK